MEHEEWYPCETCNGEGTTLEPEKDEWTGKIYFLKYKCDDCDGFGEKKVILFSSESLLTE